MGNPTIGIQSGSTESESTRSGDPDILFTPDGHVQQVAVLYKLKRTGKRLPLYRQRLIYLVLLIIADGLVLGLAFALAYAVRFYAPVSWFQEGNSSITYYSNLVFYLIPLWLVLFAIFGLYDYANLLGGTKEYGLVFNACTAGILGVMVIDFLDVQTLVARGWLLLAWIFSGVLVMLSRFSLRRGIYYLRSKGYLLSPALIVGTNSEGQALAEQFTGWTSSGLSVIGFVGDASGQGQRVCRNLYNLGGLSHLEGLIAAYQVEELVVATTALSREELLGIFLQFGAAPNVNIRLSSGLFEILTTGVSIKSMGYVPLMSLNKVRLEPVENLVKTAMDYILTLGSFIFILPLFVVLAILIKLDSPGPIFHRRRVLGVHGRVFDALKFRTMYVNGDEILKQYPDLLAEYQANFKLKEDPRVTRVGRVLRRLSLDELPQLFNVLAGQMSLIGPRMITEKEADMYGKWRMNLLTVKPGLTGLWQVSGRSDVDYESRVRLDMQYIRNYSIWQDIFILFKTIPVVLQGHGAY
ncbi:MAG: sugar transferase [Chloroflexi bacterium]|nr:sugar transferase [Chloroflexota bacterium]